MTDAPERITAWRDYPDGVTGRWSANTYDAEDAVEYIRADLVDTKPATDCRQQELTTEQARQAGFAEGVEAAAKFIDARVNNYIDEHGSYDGTTGVTEFPGNGSEWIEEQEETSEAIRALTPVGYVALPVETAGDVLARAICREDCAFRGEPPCFEIGDWPNEECNEPGCQALAAASLAAMKGAGT